VTVKEPYVLAINKKLKQFLSINKQLKQPQFEESAKSLAMRPVLGFTFVRPVKVNFMSHISN
jgi:hypothetical protein